MFPFLTHIGIQADFKNDQNLEDSQLTGQIPPSDSPSNHEFKEQETSNRTNICKTTESDHGQGTLLNTNVTTSNRNTSETSPDKNNTEEFEEKEPTHPGIIMDDSEDSVYHDRVK